MHHPHNPDLMGKTLGAYRIEGILGRGGMAEVYRAHDHLLNRDVAIKVLHRHLSESQDYVQRFREEARRIAALNHPHIVPIYHFGEEQGYLYLVMPVLQGSLIKLLHQERRPDIAASIRIGAQVASGLACAHAKGLVHRDVKPGNILLDETGNALLADFGIARDITPARLGEQRAHEARETGELVVTGTPRYMAPEQLRGDPIDQRADIYALGAVIYYLLTGVVPHDLYNTATPLSLLIHRALEAPEPPSAYDAHIPPSLDQVILRALAGDPAQRFPDATTFGRALRNSLPMQPMMTEVMMGMNMAAFADAGMEADEIDDEADETLHRYNPARDGNITAAPELQPVPTTSTQPMTTLVAHPSDADGQVTANFPDWRLFPSAAMVWSWGTNGATGTHGSKKRVRLAATMAMLVAMACGLFFMGQELAQHPAGSAAHHLPSGTGAALVKDMPSTNASLTTTTSTTPTKRKTQPSQPVVPPQSPDHGHDGHGHGHHGHGHHHGD